MNDRLLNLNLVQMRHAQRDLIIFEIAVVLLIIYCLLRVAWEQEINPIYST